MAEISAHLVKSLRERTGAGMMDCKKALIQANGDIELAIDAMRKAGRATAAKRASRSATEGLLVVKSSPNQDYALLLEINCETDFVAKEAAFLSFCQQVAERALVNKIKEVSLLQAACDAQRVALVTQLGENIQIRRLATVQGGYVGHYLHGQRIGVIIAAHEANPELIKQVAMHIAASKPEYIYPTDVPAEVIERERNVQLAIALQSGKPKEIAEKMVFGRLSKFTSELALIEQPFLMDSSQTVGECLKAAGIQITQFTRFELGEGLEKTAIDFAAEVAAVAQLNP